jgi:hypothetical protein
MRSSPDCTSMIRRSHNPAQIIATAGLAPLAAACGGSRPSSVDTDGSANAEGSTKSPSTLAFSACMRSHGVPNFPDPNPNGRPLEVDAQEVGVSDGLYQSAEQACQPLLPTSGSLQQLTHQRLLYGNFPQTLVQQLMTLERTYAECMRSHGVPNWPDPSISAKGGRPVFDLSGAGIDTQSTDSPQFRSKERECRRLTGGDLPTLPYT